MTNQHEKHFQNHSYINLTTFRKTGAAVATPVWFVEILYLWVLQTNPMAP